MSQMKFVQVFIAGLVKHDEREGALVLLDKVGRRALPVWAFLSQGWSLYVGLKKWPRAQPWTFHFVENVVKATGAELESVCITALVDNVLRATARLRVGETFQHVDARPIDAITLAVYTDSPIYVAQEVMEQAGVLVTDKVWQTARPDRRLDGDPVLERFVKQAYERRMAATQIVDEVVEGLYISGADAASHASVLRENGITNVLTLYLGDNVRWPDDVVVFDNALEDGQFVPQERMARGVAFIREQRRAGANVLVSCWAGISRSSTFVLAFMVGELGYDLHDAYNLLHARHPRSWPEPEMWASLLEHYELPYSMAEVKSWMRELSWEATGAF